MKRNLLYVGIFVLFIISLYLVELGPYGSRNVEKYNNGYGTFDMKSYDANKVYEVLDEMDHKGFLNYELYYLFDFLFILSFGILQTLLTHYAYSWLYIGTFRNVIVGIPIVRGVLDMLENGMLLRVLFTYPQKQDNLIGVSGIITLLKLRLIPIWCLLFITGIIIKIYRKVSMVA